MRNPFAKRRPRNRREPTTGARAYQLAMPGAGAALQRAPQRTADADVLAALDDKRAQSRQEAQNGDYLAGFMLAAQRNVVGQGIRLRSKHPDPGIAREVEGQWEEWSGRCSPSGDHWWALEWLALGSLVTDGEVVAHLTPEGRWGLQVRLVDAATLAIGLNGRLADGSVVSMGVERRGWTARAYWFRRWADRAATDGDYHATRRLTRIPAEQIVHLPYRSFVAQTRGMPFATPALVRMEQLRHYEASEMVAARIGTRKHGYLITESGGEPPYEPEERKGEGEGEGEGDKPDDPIGDSTRWSRQDGTGDVEYGVNVTQLDPGQTFQSEDWPHPNAAYGDFVTGQLRGAAAGLGTSYHALSGDLSRVNFSAGRIGEIGSRQTWLFLRKLLSSGFHQRVFEAWVRTASMRGILPGLPSDLARAEWVGEGFPHIQPREQARADDLQIANGLSSVSQKIREAGREPDEVFQEIADERRRMKELGIG